MSFPSALCVCLGVCVCICEQSIVHISNLIPTWNTRYVVFFQCVNKNQCLMKRQKSYRFSPLCIHTFSRNVHCCFGFFSQFTSSLHAISVYHSACVSMGCVVPTLFIIRVVAGLFIYHSVKNKRTKKATTNMTHKKCDINDKQKLCTNECVLKSVCFVVI